MIVPAFWAEGRVQHREKRKQITVRRYGWSDRNQEEAQAMADERAREALHRILTDDAKAERIEPKVPYNGAEGVPIREEIVSRHGNSVITRNSHGARCLNTPNVLFADMDFEDLESSASWKRIALECACVSHALGIARNGSAPDFRFRRCRGAGVLRATARGQSVRERVPQPAVP